MLTIEQLALLYTDGRLRRWSPQAKRRPVVAARTLLMTQEVLEQIDNPMWPRGDHESAQGPRDRRLSFHAQLERYIEGAMLWPKEEIKLLRATDPLFADLFEFRSRPPNPQVRMFGYFLRPGAFVALAFKQRDDLGDKEDSEWLETAKEVDAIWRTLGGPNKMKATGPVETRKALRGFLDG